MRACEEEDGSLREGFSHSRGLVDVPGAPDAPSWPIHRSAGGRGRMQRVVVAGSLLSANSVPLSQTGIRQLFLQCSGLYRLGLLFFS